MSFASTEIVIGVSSSVDAASGEAVGGVFELDTAILTVARFEVAVPSLARYVNVSVPVNPVFGV